MPGCSFWNPAISRGAKYLAVETAPSFNVPILPSEIAANSSSNDRKQPSIDLAASIVARPATVARSPSEVRSNSSRPVSASACCNCSVTAGAVNPITLAASEMRPVWLMATSVRNWRRVKFSIP